VVKRYTDPGDESYRATVYEDATGEFVRFEDYERLRLLLAEIRGQTLDAWDAAFYADRINEVLAE
jgi:hypothetical protein